MPNKWTFSIPQVKIIFNEYKVGGGWCDMFAGLNSPAEVTNDIEGLGNQFQMDALEFLKTQEAEQFDGVLFDPPYSVEQCLRKYTPMFKGTAGRTEYWAACKIEIARVVKKDGLTISFGWNSSGIGKKRGFDIEHIVLLSHGGLHNDTIITIDRKR